MSNVVVETNGAVKLNIGAGDCSIDGYTSIDRKLGKEAYPLDYADGSVEEIYASHVLEHFSHLKTAEVLKDWVRVLEPGGRLRIAVPDFDKLDRADPQWPGHLMGGQTDDDDIHRAVFTKGMLTNAMVRAGIDFVEPFESEYQDCSRFPVSLNLMGKKAVIDDPENPPKELRIKIVALTSIPRVGWNDHWGCMVDALNPFKIPIRRGMGAFWGQTMQNVFEDAIEAGADWGLTIDYDTMFTKFDLDRLFYWFGNCPEIDALCAIQPKRCSDQPLFGLVEKKYVDWDGNPVRVDTAHFGLSLFRLDLLEKMPKPWFHSVPNEDGGWRSGKVDDDIYFWHRWKEAGHSVYVAPDVRVGHLELMVSEFDEEIKWRSISVNDWRERNGQEIKTN